MHVQERYIQQTILAYLGFLERQGKGYFFRNNQFAGRIQRPNSSSVGYISNQKRGAPDICGVYRGRFIGIEVKAKTGRLSEFQKEAQARIEKAGGLYIVAHDVNTVKDALESVSTTSSASSSGA